MNSYFGFVYYVSVKRYNSSSNYVVKINHLDEFVALMEKFDSIVVTKLVKTCIDFDHVYQWYKAL